MIDFYTLFIAALFGLLLGSFFNVVLHRLPQTDAAGLLGKPEHTLMYLAYPYSFCPRCRTPIRPWHNIPLLSFVLLRGKSACCASPIGWRYPLVELVGAAITCTAVWHYSHWLDITFVVLFLSFLFIAAAIDWQRYYLLDILTLPLLWLGLAANFDARFALLHDAVLGAGVGYVALHAVAIVFSFIIKKRAMGAGDPKLFAAIGAWLGWQMLPAVLFIAALLGLLLAAVRYAMRRRGGRHIPFGPCLAAAAAVMLLYGDEIIVGYWQFVTP